MSEQSIWLPGIGVVPPDVRTAQLAIEAYDDRLELGRNERNGEWVVLWKNGPDGAPFPVLGLGDQLPGYEEIQRRLYQGDTVRRGGDLVREVQRRQDQRKREADAEMHDRAGEVAEALEHAFHRMGKTSYKRVYLPGKD